MSTTVEEIENTEVSEEKKDSLLLDSLEIKGYRCFEHLTIEKLGRVNLIVGKNNVGKTALLETLWIYANKGYSLASYDSLRNRDEFPFENGQNVPPENRSAIKNLFFSRPSLAPNSPDVEFLIGEVKKPIKPEAIDNNLTMLYQGLENQVLVKGVPPNNSFGHPQISETVGRKVKDFESYFIRTSFIENKDLVMFWDEIEKKVLEDSIIKALKMIDDNLEDIRFSGYFSDYSNGSNIRVPVVRLKNAKERVALKSLGEGMTHLLAIALTLVKCKDGILLIDEIESGLHYSVLPDVWKLVFKTAKDLNVQVFATTHSKDCVEAFAAAAEESPEEGMLIRLERHGEKIVAKTIEEERLVDAVNFDVEVR